MVPPEVGSAVSSGAFAALLGALAAVLWLPAAARVDARVRRPRRAAATLAVVGGLAALVVSATGPAALRSRLLGSPGWGGGLARVAAVGLVLGGALLAGAALWRRRAAARAAREVSARVLETCVLLAGELRAGRTAGDALAVAAREWPPLGLAAEAFALGADVPQAIRRLAAEPGAGALSVLAAAWQVAHRSGQGLAETVAAVADQLRADRATQRVVESELASARATARLVAGLPVAALVLGSGLGGDPWHFLLATAPGLACLAGGLGLLLAGLGWIERIAGGVLGP